MTRINYRVINCHGVNEGEELFQEKRLNSQAKYC